MKIGFIGLGIMGRPMALNLCREKHELVIWARRSEAMQPLLAAGARAAANPAAVAAEVEILITMVADAPDVEEVLLGPEGAAASANAGASAGMNAGLIAVDMSTIAPKAAQNIGERLARHGIVFVDAPVSGGEAGAIAGTLSIMAGGPESAFARLLPIFSAMGKNIVHVGPSGCGQIAKACNQILTGVGILAVAEALTLAKKAGADPARVREALLGGFARSKILENHGLRMLEGDFQPGFKSWMHQKDLNIVMQSAHALGVALPGSAAAAQMFNAMVGSGMGEEDSVALIKLLEQISGTA